MLIRVPLISPLPRNLLIIPQITEKIAMNDAISIALRPADFTVSTKIGFCLVLSLDFDKILDLSL